MRKILNIILFSSTLPFLQGCVPAALVSGTAGIGTTLAEDRKLTEVMTDTEIRTVIMAKWVNHDSSIMDMVNVQVRQGRVLLTGLVDTPLRQMDAVRLAWEANGVKEVIDETRVGDNSFGTYATDTWITTKLKTEMLFDQDISSVNYNIKTVDSTVYLIGIAQNQQELDKVMNMARKISGVKNVVNHMRMKNGGSAETTPFSYSEPSSVREAEPIVVQQEPTQSYGNSFPSPKAQ